MGLGIWVVVLTLLILITVIIVFMRTSKDKKEKREPPTRQYSSPDDEIIHAHPEWMSSLREENVKVLPVETIDERRRPRQNGGPRHNGHSPNGYVVYKVA